jgi:hypothetical protein
MPTAPRDVVIGTRTSRETKNRFGALAAQRGLTESALLALLLDEVLAPWHDGAPPSVAHSTDVDSTSDRLTVRLRPGDRGIHDARAAGRRMKTATYLSMLVRSHVREIPVMPPRELEELRCTVGHLALLGREMRSLEASNPSAVAVTGADLWLDVGRALESVREAVAALVRANLRGWETGHA